MGFLDLVLIVGITVRLAFLVTQDDLLDGPRARAETWARARGEPRGLRRAVLYWSTCAWCCSPYLAFGAVALWEWAPEHLFLGVGALCTASLAAGVAQERL